MLHRLQRAQDDLRRLLDEVRSFAAPIQLECSTCDLASAWREAWNLLETVRRGRDAALDEDVGSCRFEDSCRSLPPGAAVSQFAGEFAGSLQRSCADWHSVSRSDTQRAAGDRDFGPRQRSGAVAGGTAERVRALLHHQDQGHRPWHGDCKTNRRRPRRTNRIWARPPTEPNSSSRCRETSHEARNANRRRRG